MAEDRSSGRTTKGSLLVIGGAVALLVLVAAHAAVVVTGVDHHGAPQFVAHANEERTVLVAAFMGADAGDVVRTDWAAALPPCVFDRAYWRTVGSVFYNQTGNTTYYWELRSVDVAALDRIENETSCLEAEALDRGAASFFVLESADVDELVNGTVPEDPVFAAPASTPLYGEAEFRRPAIPPGKTTNSLFFVFIIENNGDSPTADGATYSLRGTTLVYSSSEALLATALVVPEVAAAGAVVVGVVRMIRGGRQAKSVPGDYEEMPDAERLLRLTQRFVGYLRFMSRAHAVLGVLLAGTALAGIVLFAVVARSAVTPAQQPFAGWLVFLVLMATVAAVGIYAFWVTHFLRVRAEYRRWMDELTKSPVVV